MVRVDLIQLLTPTGRKIRKVTRVTLNSGRKVTFNDRLPKRRAIKLAKNKKYW